MTVMLAATATIATAGAAITARFTVMSVCPSASMVPQLATPGSTPIRRNASAANTRIAVTKSSIAVVMMVARTFGSRWRKMIRASDSPIVRAAAT